MNAQSTGRPSITSSFANHEARIRALERRHLKKTTDLDDYVFLGHVIPGADEPIDIDVAALTAAKGGVFTHIIVEANLYQDIGSIGDDLDSLWIQWGPDTSSIITDGYWGGVVRFYSDDNPTAAEGMFATGLPSGHADDYAVVIPNIIIPTFGCASALTMKFPWYKSVFATRRTVMAQGVTINKTPDNGIARSIISGGGGNIDHTDEIGAIRLSSNDDFGGDTIVNVYGIRGA